MNSIVIIGTLERITDGQPIDSAVFNEIIPSPYTTEHDQWKFSKSREWEFDNWGILESLAESYKVDRYNNLTIITFFTQRPYNGHKIWGYMSERGLKVITTRFDARTHRSHVYIGGFCVRNLIDTTSKFDQDFLEVLLTKYIESKDSLGIVKNYFTKSHGFFRQ
jgi:hypothetical protein